ncbi:MAG: ribosome small subunit-dependent GTPase A [Clostridia bacterium]
MNNMINGKVIKAISGTFYVDCGNKVYECKARKKTRYVGSEVTVGDNVQFIMSKEGDYGSIENVLPRRNCLIRPRISNIDRAFIVISTIPTADLLLIDKIIVNCAKEKILPFIVVNKTDLSDNNFYKEIQESYSDVVEKILYISTYNGNGMAELKNELIGNTSCFLGQSAVGKTSIVNFITGNDYEIGSMSTKIARGKNTTRYSEIYTIYDNTYVVDTSGFSLLEGLDINSNDLCLYYSDLFAYSKDCRFNMCSHTTEPNCAVIQAVKEGKINNHRYERYVALFNELRETEKNKYD